MDRFKVETHLGSPMGLAGEVPSKGILPRSDQEYLSLGSEECGQGGGFLPQDGITSFVTVIWYFGGFISNGAGEKICLAGKVEGRAESVGNLAGISRKHLQSDYDGLHK